VAFMFVLFLASVNLVSANPICTECGKNTTDSASKTVSVGKSFVFHVLIYSQRSLVLVSGVLW